MTVRWHPLSVSEARALKILSPWVLATCCDGCTFCVCWRDDILSKMMHTLWRGHPPVPFAQLSPRLGRTSTICRVELRTDGGLWGHLWGPVVTTMPLLLFALLCVADTSVLRVASCLSQSFYICMATAWCDAGSPVFCPVDSKVGVLVSSHSCLCGGIWVDLVSQKIFHQTSPAFSRQLGFWMHCRIRWAAVVCCRFTTDH